MMKNHNSNFSFNIIWLILVSILFVKLISHGFYPIIDTSEARYAEMARKMVELNNWITPMYNYNEPFWGKPPLAVWTQAIGIKILGFNEFAPRLSSWLFHLGSCILIMLLGKNSETKHAGLFAALTFTTCFLGLITSGAIITDPALCFFSLLAFYGFWKHISENKYIYALLGFLALGLGILTKGFLILILFGLPVLAWIIINNYWHRFSAIPWIPGITLMLAVSLPWFLIAEWKTPGFLNYFVLGEHWQRFIVKDWEGDLYGDAHEEAVGTIWIYLIVGLLPWSLFLPALWSTIRNSKNQYTKKWHSFLLCWGLGTPIFFTLSQNVLWTYVLPALPAWSLLISESILNSDKFKVSHIKWAALIVPIAYLITIAEGSYFDKVKNQKNIINVWKESNIGNNDSLYYIRRYYSADFYSQGGVKTVSELHELPSKNSFYLAIRERDFKRYYENKFLNCKTKNIINKTRLLHCQNKTQS